jgi:hypothetical protein
VLCNAGARGLTKLTVHITHAAFIAILQPEDSPSALARDNLYHATPSCVGLDWETGELCLGVDIPAGGMYFSSFFEFTYSFFAHAHKYTNLS